MQKEAQAHGKQGFLKNMFGGEQNFFISDVFADVKKAIQERLKYILIACMYCWNHMQIFEWTDYHFTRYGMFAYNHEDKKKLLEKIRKKRNPTMTGESFIQG